MRTVVDALAAPLWVVPAFEQGLSVKDYEEAGVKILAGIEGLFAAAKAVMDVYRELKETGTISEKHCQTPTAMPEISRILKVAKWTDLGQGIQGNERDPGRFVFRVPTTGGYNRWVYRLTFT